MSFAFAPKGWAFCDGQLLPINQNQALFALLGTTYGGDGQVNFALPDLRAKTPIHVGNGHLLGETGGEQAHTISIAEMPTHFHLAQASSNTGDTPIPTNGLLASALNAYRPADSVVSLHPGTVSNTGGSQPHQNMQPYLVLTFCIALTGLFPTRN